MIKATHALVALLLVVPTTANAAMSEQDRLARCETNQAEIVRLQTQITATPGYLPLEQIARAKAMVKALNRYVTQSRWGMAPYLGDPNQKYDFLQLMKSTAEFLPKVNQCRDVTTFCLFETREGLNDLIDQAAEVAPTVQPLLDQIEQRKERLIELQCVQPEPPPGLPASGWQDEGSGDCSGDDEASTSGPVPNPGMCTPERAGKAAVCWDGKTFINTYGESHGAPDYPWCTYKSTGDCGGGSNIGKLYYCRP